MKYSTLIFTLATLLLLAAKSQAVSIDISNLPANSIAIDLHYLEDKNKDLTLADVRKPEAAFKPVTAPALNLGFTESVFWFKTSLSSPVDVNWIIDLDYPMLDHIELYQISGGEITKIIAGDKLPFDSRMIKDRSFAFPLTYKTGDPELEIYLKVQTSGSMQVPVKLWQADAFYSHDHNEQLVLGFFYGVLLSALLYNLILAFALREPVYGYYCAYVASYTMFQLSINGLAFEYLWPGSQLLAHRAIPITMILGGLTALLFSRSFLQLEKNHPALNKLYKAAAAPYILIVPFVFTADYQTVVKILTVNIMFSGILLWITGWITLTTQGSNGKYFLLAWSALLLGGITFGLKTMSYLPHTFLTEYAMQIGAAAEVLLLSFAIAARFHKLRDANIRIQKEATATLEHKVAQRTTDLHQAMGQLKIANKKLESLNTLDELTGIHNRSYFNTRYKQLWESARRDKTDLSVLMIDIDHFKNTNDKHGHLTGDRVISVVADAISDTLYRSTDMLARYGGEEFVVVLPSTHQSGATAVAEKIRARVIDTKINIDDVSISITVSIGAATLTPDRNTRRLTLLANADKALYEAKNNGRNQVCTWCPQAGIAA